MWFWSSFNSDLNTDLTPISSYSDSDCDLMHVRFHLDLTLIPFWSQTKHVTKQTLILILIFFCFSSARDHFLKLFSVSSCHISKNGTKRFVLFHTLPCFREIFLFPSREQKQQGLWRLSLILIRSIADETFKEFIQGKKVFACHSVD